MRLDWGTFKSRLYTKQNDRAVKALPFHLVQVTGFPPVAALADEQLSTVRSYGQIAMQFSPYFKSHRPYKQNEHNPGGAVLILLVRMTGFEPTRISSLEPETSASAVPPHLHIKLKVTRR